MRPKLQALVLAFGLALAAAPALAETVAPGDAQKYIGRTVTIEGVVSDVHHAASGSAIFLNFGDRYPDQTFTAVIFQANESKFPDVDALEGKAIDVTGPVRRYKGRPEIILNDPGQIKMK